MLCVCCVCAVFCLLTFCFYVVSGAEGEGREKKIEEGKTEGKEEEKNGEGVTQVKCWRRVCLCVLCVCCLCAVCVCAAKEGKETSEEENCVLCAVCCVCAVWVLCAVFLKQICVVTMHTLF